MSDLTLDVLRRLEQTPPIRPAFADALYETLAQDLGFRELGPLAGVRRRLRAAIGLDGRLAPAPGPVWALVLVGLLLAALVGLMLVGATLLRRSPADLVRLSEAVYDHPPAFSETFQDGSSRIHRLSADGNGTWRVDDLGIDGTPTGDYDLYDGTRVGHYDATSRVWTSGPLLTQSGGVPPFPLTTEFTWTRLEATSGPPIIGRVACQAAEWLGSAVVAGRQADHLRCGDTNMQYWLDQSSHLVLRIEAGRGTPNWDPGRGLEAASLEVGLTQDPARFAWSGPPGATGPEDEPASHLLAAGDVLPNIVGTTLGGGSFQSDSLRGRPATILIWGEGIAAPDLRVFAAATKARADRLAAVVVFYTEGTAKATIEATDVGFGGTAVVPATLLRGHAGGADALGLNYWPALIIVDASGRILSIGHSVGNAADLDPMLDAAIAGGRVPTPPRTPAPGVAAKGVSDRLVVGQSPPDWTLPRPAGVTMSLRDLAGAPAIVYYGDPNAGDDYSTARTAILAALASASGRGLGALRVIVVDAEPFMTADDVAALSSRLGLTVVPDRDGIVSRAWGLAMYDDLVFLDVSGRVVSFSAGPCQDVPGLVDRFTGGQPMPSPSYLQSGPGCP